MTSAIPGFFFGVDEAIISEARLYGESVSDNSLFLLQLKFGFIFTAALIFFTIWLINVYFFMYPYFCFGLFCHC